MQTPSFQHHPTVARRDVKLAGVQYENNPGAEHSEHIVNTTAICNSSASHTYGNVISLIEKYILTEIFPNNEFHTVTIGTTLGSRQVRHIPSQLRKKELPMMVLIPRISFGQEDNRFLGHTLMNDRYTNTHALWGDGSLLPLVIDARNRLYVHGHYNRAVLYIDVILAYDSFNEQTNAMSTLYNFGSVNHPKEVQAPLELYIPDGLTKLISNLVKVPCETEKDIYNFLKYMNGSWVYPITYKLKGGSNTNEFFMYYVTPIDVLLQDPQPGQGIKDGQIRRGYDINFTIRCDFNTVGYFTLNHPEVVKQIDIPTHEDDTIIPIFSDSINLDDFQLPLGWSILTWPIFKLSQGESSVSIDPILNDSLRVMIDYHLKMGIPMDRFIKIQFRENGEILNNEAFYIDWARRMLHITSPNYRRTYRLIVSVSTDYINNTIKELYNFE